MTINNVLIELFLIFFRIGAVTFGGGYAMLPIIRVEIVDNKHWVTEEEFLDALALTQAVPGAIALNTAVFIGYKVKGVAGALCSAIGVALPSFLIILVVAMFLITWHDHPIVASFFMGIRPGVVGLILAAVYRIGRPVITNEPIKLLSLLAAMALILLGIHPILIIVIFGAGSILLMFKGRTNNDHH